MTSKKGRGPTLKDIATEAGVSVPTVSKVVKGGTDVSPALRAKIQALLVERGYQARTTHAGVSGSAAVELHFDSMASTNNLQLLQGVLGAAERVGTNVVVKITPRGLTGSSWVESVSRARHSGLILVTSHMDDDQQDSFAKAGIPVVVVDPVNTPRPTIASVGVNNFDGGYLAARHLIDLGHRSIAMIRGIKSECARARLGGYHAALLEAGMDRRVDFEPEGSFRYEEGRSAANDLLTLPEAPTAIFAANDLEALGAIDAARNLGLRVPEDVSIVGFDDSLQAVSSSPRLTTVRQPFAEIGATAFRILMEIRSGDEPPTRRLELPTELIVRESTAAPPR